MIDFDGLVLAACMATFARPITVYPIKSQPGALPYVAEAIWSSRPVDVPLEDGIMSSQEHTLGIRASAFLVPPLPEDKVEIPAAGSYPRIGMCLIEDTDDDGQGGTVWSMKVIGP